MNAEQAIDFVTKAIEREVKAGRAEMPYERTALENLYRCFEYAVKITSGEKIAGNLTISACQRFLDDLDRIDGETFDFSIPRALKILKFYATCVSHVKGSNRTVGKIIDLMDWHTFILVNIFSWVVPMFEVDDESGELKHDDSGNKIPVFDNRGVPVWVRRYRTAYIEVARKNAKSTLSSGIGLYMTGFDGEGGAEVYSAATTRDQARIVFDDSKKMIQNNKLLQRRLGVNKMNIHQLDTASKFEPLSSDANTLDGLNIHCGIVDELHAHKTRDVWDVLETATGSRDQSLILGITTAGTILDGICFEIRSYAKKLLEKTIGNDDTFFGLIYTLDEGDDPFDQDVWFKANPGLGKSKSWDDLKRLAKKAKEEPAALPNFMTKHLNIWVRNAQAWLRHGSWEKCQNLEYAEGSRCIVAIDLADKIDICAAVKVHQNSANPKQIHCEFKFWLPEDRLNECSQQMKQIYTKFANSGHLELMPGTVIDHDVIEEDIEKWVAGESLECISFDPWKSNHLTRSLEKKGYPVLEVPQTVKNLSQAMKETEGLIYNGDMYHDSNPVMEWMMSNVVVKIDKNDNIFPQKEHFENKIDGPVCLFTAMNRVILGGDGYGLEWYDEDEDIACF